MTEEVGQDGGSEEFEPDVDPRTRENFEDNKYTSTAETAMVIPDKGLYDLSKVMRDCVEWAPLGQKSHRNKKR